MPNFHQPSHQSIGRIRIGMHPFLTLLCLAFVASTLPEYSYTANVCTLDKDSGPCKGNFPKWYFNSVTKRCEIFTYGGCDGNANRFE